MPDNTITVTDLEGYRYYQTHEWLTFGKYLDQLLRREPPSPAMEWGTKWHRYLQDMAMGRDVSHNPSLYGEYEWQVEPELLQPEVVEMAVSKVYVVNGREVLMRGRIDAKVGRTIIDYKTSKSPDMESYMDSYQWRAYLDMEGNSDMFRYDVFTMSEPMKKKVAMGNKIITTTDEYRVVRDYNYIELSKYPTLHEDVQARVAEYDEFLCGLANAGEIALAPNGSGVLRRGSGVLRGA